jgi:uncharacterized protein YcfL
MRRGIFALLFLLLLTACSSSNNSSLTAGEEWAIVKADNEKEALRYGMSREAAEKILGKGEDSGITRMKLIQYEDGIQAMYRDKKVVMLVLDYQSEGVYQVERGGKVGMTSEQFKEIYGKDNVIESPGKSLDYLYNINNNTYLTEPEMHNVSGDEQMKELRQLSAVFDDSGAARFISIGDRLMAKEMR